MVEGIVTLIGKTYSFDDYGNQISTDTEKEVFAEIQSVSQTEFFEAGQTDFKAEYKVIIWDCEYSNERVIEYNNQQYSVYRTFLKGDKIELYLSQKVGV